MALDKQGNIVLPPSGCFQANFQPVIADVIERLSLTLANKLHSIYIYGSVANNSAVEQISDLDICLIFNDSLSEIEYQLLCETGLSLEITHPIVSKIDFDIGVINEVLAPKNLYSWGYWLKHHCRCVFGEDLTQKFSPFKPSKMIAVAVNGDFSQVINNYIKQLVTSTDNLQKRKLQRAAARKLIRSTEILRQEEDNDWPETLDQYVEKFVACYPNKSKAIYYFLSESLTPSDDVKHFIKLLTVFVNWLENAYFDSISYTKMSINAGYIKNINSLA